MKMAFIVLVDIYFSFHADLDVGIVFGTLILGILMKSVLDYCIEKSEKQVFIEGYEDWQHARSLQTIFEKEMPSSILVVRKNPKDKTRLEVPFCNNSFKTKFSRFLPARI